MNRDPRQHLTDDEIYLWLSGIHAEEIEHHLQMCASCRKRWQAELVAHRFLQSPSHVQAPARFSERVMEALVTSRIPEAGEPSAWPFILFAALSLGVVVLFAGAIITFVAFLWHESLLALVMDGLTIFQMLDQIGTTMLRPLILWWHIIWTRPDWFLGLLSGILGLWFFVITITWYAGRRLYPLTGETR